MTLPTDTKGRCWTCSRFGGWVPVVMGTKTRYNILGWCLHVGQAQATPANGCAHWILQVPARKAPLVWQGTT
jgi:hypothetical protein